MNPPGLLIVAKAPIAGRVKTRLCPPCSPEEAASIAEAALGDTLAAALECDRRVVLALDGPLGRWLPPGVEVVPQVSGTFNERLAAAWTHLPDGGVQIAMDTPQVDGALLSCALAGVGDHHASIGLATDGGWWIIGLHRPDPSVFAGISMSTPTTGQQQLDRLRTLGFDPIVLPTLTDIDTWCTARSVARAIPGSRTALAIERVDERIAVSR